VNFLGTYPEAVSLRYNDNYFFETAGDEPITTHIWRMWSDVDDNLVMRVADVVEPELY
jgi:hypothetical protein